ncbi:MAG: DUF4199 domain-containing protein [Saprospiraceae bacterium]
MSEQDDFLTQPQAAPKWPLAIRYGLLTALALFVVGLALMFSGLVDPIARKGTGISILLQILVLFGGMYVAINEYKKECGNTITFGKALSFGALTALVIAIAGGLLAILQVTVINPEMTAQIQEMAIAQMEEQGLTEEQIEQQMNFMKIFTGPVGVAISGAISQFIFAFIVALPVAGIHQNAKTNSIA